MAERFEDLLADLAAGAVARTSTAGSGTDRGAGTPGSTETPEHPSVAALFSQFPDAVLRHEVMAGDEHVVFVPAERNVEILGWLKDERVQAYDLLVDLTAVDFGGGRPLQVVYQLWSIEHRRQLRLKAELPLDSLEIETVTGLWATANWLEREVFDMFGIRFRGHPDLRRILMPADYAEGHPLRKDFPLRGRFSRAEQTRRALAGTVEAQYTAHDLDLNLSRRRVQQSASRVGDPAHDVDAPRREGDER